MPTLDKHEPSDFPEWSLAHWFYTSRRHPYRVVDPMVLGSMHAQGLMRANVRATQLLRARLP